ncbi:hypothetical protein [Spirosoma sp. KUDC1026]|uniref:hypothetical protein n=1 Tax=Spirosoma sp. KUDC1026 TaxID=2745947 RepID=UPI00159B99B5|nr:hypothetical protein [Spirosoma sp. KUDC1026]QKZ13893.1 hypothetical protein HU175_15130 [Spirosoma sp. KUDC1026]
MHKCVLFFITLGSAWLTGCVNLRSVEMFSNSTLTTVQQGATLPATFSSVYRNRTQTDSLDRHPFAKTPVIGINFTDRVRQDSFRSYRLADSLTLAGRNLIQSYFQTLHNLSATGKSFVPVQLQSPSFENYLQNSRIKLSADEVIAFNRIVNTIASAATSTYRRQKLVAFLENSYPDMQRLLAVEILAYNRLADVIAISREQQYNSYKNRLIRDPKLAYSEKYDLAQQWIKTASTIEQTRQTVLTYVKSLRTIQVGYDELYRQRRELKHREILLSLSTYVATLNQLQTDLEQLKPVYGRLYP